MSGFELGALAGMGTAIGVIAIVLIVLTVIAHWRMFTKAGVEGWKAIIPVYSDYVLFDLVWDTRNFWIYIGITIVTSALNALASNIDGGIIMSAITYVAGIAAMIWYVRLQVNTSLAYGKGMAFAIGLVLLPTVFTLMIGFGKADYVGPQG